MKVALVFAGITRGGWNVFGKGADEENYVPLGLALLTAICKCAGHEVCTLDLRQMTGWDDFVGRAAATGARVFGFSAMSVDYDTVQVAAKLVKEAIPGAVAIVGGVHPTLCTEWVEADAVWDHIVVGEGEETFPALLGAIAGKQPRVIRQTRPVPLDDLPFPDRDAWDWERGEKNHPWARLFPAPFVAMIGGRGCPYACRFCAPANNRMWGGKPRYRSMDSVFRELDFLRAKYQFKTVMFYDDLLIARPKETLAFAERYKREGFTANMICQARADITAKHPETIEAMASAGLKMTIIGFESNNQRILDFINKGTTTEQNRKAVEVCGKNGVWIMANLIFGFPTETEAEMKDTADFALWADAAVASPIFFSPTPGTWLWDYCVQNDLLLGNDPRGFRRDFLPKIKGVNYQCARELAQKVLKVAAPRLRSIV